jgi:hypothetical protein
VEEKMPDLVFCALHQRKKKKDRKSIILDMGFHTGSFTSKINTNSVTKRRVLKADS